MKINTVYVSIASSTST